MPVKCKTEIREGHVKKIVDGIHYRFEMPEIFAGLGTGYRVLIAFDPGDPAAGCHIYNLETGSRNVNVWPEGHYIGLAKHNAGVCLRLPVFQHKINRRIRTAFNPISRQLLMRSPGNIVRKQREGPAAL